MLSLEEYNEVFENEPYSFEEVFNGAIIISTITFSLLLTGVILSDLSF